MLTDWLDAVDGKRLAIARVPAGFELSPTSRVLAQRDLSPLAIPFAELSELSGRKIWVGDINSPDAPLLRRCNLQDARTAADVLQVPHPDVALSSTELADWVADQKEESDENAWAEVLRNVSQQQVWWRVHQRGFKVDPDLLLTLREEVKDDRASSRERVGTDLFDNREALRFLEERGIFAYLGEKVVTPVTHKLWHLAEVPPDFAEDWEAFKDIRARARTVLKIQEIERFGGLSGRIPTRWHVSGASRTGRMSSERVQMQNIPVTLRPLFQAERGNTLLQCDLNRAEPTIAAWLSGDAKLAAALDGDLYTEVAEQVGGITRAEAKVVLLGLLYGEGDAALARQLNTDKGNARSIRDGILDTYPDLARWRRQITRRARRDGYIQNGYGRRLVVPAGEDYKAVNYACQSTASAVLLDMVDRILDHRLLGEKALWLAIHDEILLQVPEADEQAERLEALRECMTLKLAPGIVIAGEPQVIGSVWRK